MLLNNIVVLFLSLSIQVIAQSDASSARYPLANRTSVTSQWGTTANSKWGNTATSSSLGLTSVVSQTTASSTQSTSSTFTQADVSDPEESDRAANAQQVMCNAYLSTNMHNQAIAPCYPFCGQLVSHPKDGSSVTCLSAGQNLPVYKDKDGNQYNPGVCRCDLPILNDMANVFIQAVEAIGIIGCEILFSTLDSVLQVASLAIPGAGELDAADAGMQVAVKAATQMADKGQDALDFLNMFGGPCPSNNYSLSGDNIFLPLIGRGSPGKGLVKGSDGKVPDKPPPMASDPVKTDPAKSDPKTTAPSTATKTTASHSKSTSESSSSSACSSKSTGKSSARSLHRRVDHIEYDPPNQCDTNKIVDMLRAYDTNPATRDELIELVIAEYMHNSNPPADEGMFYQGPATEQAAIQKAINGKETIETVFWGYNNGPFDPELQPMKDVTAKGLQKAWFRATSAAFARVVSGKAFFIYAGNNWKDAKGGDGLPSIFITDELPEMQASGKVTEVYQICPEFAELWTVDTEPAFAMISSLTCAANEQPQKGTLPAKLIWSKASAFP